MFDQCRDLNPDCFVIAGDIVHSKTQGISPELIDCLNWWFTEMSRIAPVHVMLGNHDGLIMNTDRQDAISPILRALNLQKVYLYKIFNSFSLDDFSIKWDNAVPKPNHPVRLYLNCVQENTQGIALKS